MITIPVKLRNSNNTHCAKCRNFTYFPGVEILRDGAVYVQFWAIRPKLCGNCAFPQNFHTKKLGEITAFYAVTSPEIVKKRRNGHIDVDFAQDRLKNLNSVPQIGDLRWIQYSLAC